MCPIEFVPKQQPYETCELPPKAVPPPAPDNVGSEDRFEVPPPSVKKFLLPEFAVQHQISEAEFPAYLHSNDPIQQARIAKKVNLAIASVLRRLELPYKDPQSGEIKRNEFFKVLEQQIIKLTPGASVHISGGVVRGILGYIYKKVYNEHQRNSDPSATEKVLERIIEGSSRKELQGPLLGDGSLGKGYQPGSRMMRDKGLPQLAALGIGSDLDISIDFPPETSDDVRRQAMSSAKLFIDSAVDHMMPNADKRSVLNRSLFPIGDAVDLRAQLDRSTRQGGSPLDWLTFPINQENAEVQEHTLGTMEQFFKGEIDYQPLDQAEIRDQTCIRMLRPLLEMPFLKPSEKTTQILERELELIRDNLRRGGSLSSLAAYEFEKLMRNARFEGGHNRFTEHNKNDRIASLVHEISNLSKSVEKSMPIVPEFSRRQDISKRNLTEEQKKANAWLMNPTDFIERYTDRGILYHGTPKQEYALSMMRNGVTPSIPQKQGTAAFGSGFYTAQNRNISTSYAANEGTIFEIPVNPSQNLRILDLQQFISSHPEEYKTCNEKSFELGININEFMARQYAIDVIFNTYPIVLNPDALEMPKTMKELVRTTLSQDLQQVVTNRKEKVFLAMLKLAKIQGLQNLKKINIKSFFETNKSQNDEPDRSKNSIQFIASLCQEEPNCRVQLEDLIESQDAHIRNSALLVLNQLRDSKDAWTAQRLLVQHLVEDNVASRSEIVDIFAKIDNIDERTQELLLNHLNVPGTPDDIKNDILRIFSVIHQISLQHHEHIAGFLKNPQLFEAALSASSSIAKQQRIAPTFIASLAHQLEGHLTNNARESIIELFLKIQINEPETCFHLVRLLHSAQQDVQDTALKILGSAAAISTHFNADTANNRTRAILQETLIRDPAAQLAIARSLDRKTIDPKYALKLLNIAGPPSTNIQEEIIRLLSNDDPEVVSSSLQAIALAQPMIEEAQNSLARLLARTTTHQLEILNITRHITKPISPLLLKQLIPLVESNDTRIGEAASACLSRFLSASTSDEVYLNEIGRSLEHVNPTIRERVNSLLENVKPTHSDLLAQLVKCLNNTQSEISRNAGKTLTTILSSLNSSQQGDTIGRLLNATREQQRDNLPSLIHFIASRSFNIENNDLVRKELIDSLEHGTHEAMTDSLRILGSSIGPISSNIKDRMEELAIETAHSLASEDPSQRSDAIKLLKLIGLSSEKVQKEILPLLSNDNPEVVSSSLQAIALAQPMIEEAQNSLARLLAKTTPHQLEILNTTRHITKPISPLLLDQLIPLVASNDSKIGEAAIACLFLSLSATPEHESYLNQIASLLNHSNPTILERAERLLNHIRPTHNDLLVTLAMSLQTPTPNKAPDKASSILRTLLSSVDRSQQGEVIDRLFNSIEEQQQEHLSPLLDFINSKCKELEINNSFLIKLTSLIENGTPTVKMHSLDILSSRMYSISTDLKQKMIGLTNGIIDREEDPKLVRAAIFTLGKLDYKMMVNRFLQSGSNAGNISPYLQAIYSGDLANFRLLSDEQRKGIKTIIETPPLKDRKSYPQAYMISKWPN